MKSFQHEFVKIPGSITVIESPIGRRYETPEGIFPSVTSVTGWQKRSFFAGWQSRYWKSFNKRRARHRVVANTKRKFGW